MKKSQPADTSVEVKKTGPRWHLFSLRIKFIAVFTFLILLVMGVVTTLILYQVRQTLVEQIINRAEAQATGLATNSVDPIIRLSQPTTQAGSTGPAIGGDDFILLMQFTNDAMKEGAGSAVRDIPSGLSPWEEQVLQASNVAYGMIQKYLWPNESQVQNNDMEYVKILDKNANEIADNKIQNVMEHVVYKNPEGTKPLGDEPILTQSYNADGRTLYDIAAPILNTAEGHKDKIGEVHIGMNENTINRVVRYVGVSIVLTTVVFILLGIIIVTIFVTVMIIPIKLLVRGVHAIGEGNFDQNINIQRGDELGDLTDAFNNMAKSLREKEVMKGAFSKYVSKSVVDRIMEHQDGLKLGGEKKVISVFFSDIRGFTTISEILSAQEVVQLLNEYFTAMTAIIFKHEGTLNKFIGDAIMAIYGAPIDYPDHAKRAVLASLEMSQKVKELQEKWKMEGKIGISIGMGVNTGEVVVGNIGSVERMEYTAIGDGVNLSSRLEGTTKSYHVELIISESTYEKVKHDILCRELDNITVKGKTKPIRIFEPLDLRSRAAGTMLEKKVSLFEEGLAFYRTQRWDEAVQKFKNCLVLDPEDGPAQVFIERSKVLKSEPPPADWNCVFEMKTK